MFVLKLGALALTLGIGLGPALAAEQHAGDVQPWLENGKVQTNATYFEADFGDLAGGLYRTDDPGYDADTAKGPFGAGNWLRFEGLGNLRFWNGSSWGAPVAGETVRIDDALGDSSDPTDDTIFGGSGVTKPLGVIGEFDAAGDIHEHLDMAIRNASNALGGTIGAYWITLRLFDSLPNSESPVSTPSDAFHIIFNRGLSAENYEAAVSAAVVPVPAAVWLFGSALGAMGVFGRRRHGAGSA